MSVIYDNFHSFCRVKGALRAKWDAYVSWVKHKPSSTSPSH